MHETKCMAIEYHMRRKAVKNSQRKRQRQIRFHDAEFADGIGGEKLVITHPIELEMTDEIACMRRKYAWITK